MTKRPVKDVAASVRQRLQNVARETNRPFQEVLQYFAMERFLYRLARSPHADKFVLKGALMFTVWNAPTTRPTRDIDLLARMNNSTDTITSVIRQICHEHVEPDGLVFDATSVNSEAIKEDADYAGVRVTFLAYLQNARVPMQIDMGFGDVIIPKAAPTDYPTLLDFNAPRLHGYTRETVVAEKFEAMVKLGLLNSRMKDFFDVWLLAHHFDFDGPTLLKAVARTFANRKTSLSARPVALTGSFPADRAKAMQWRGFLKKSRLRMAPQDLGEVVTALAAFLLPLAEAVTESRTFDLAWKAPGPWQVR